MGKGPATSPHCSVDRQDGSSEGYAASTPRPEESPSCEVKRVLSKQATNISPVRITN